MDNKFHPHAIFIQLLTHCNAECINCPFEFTYNSIHKNGRMSDETWSKILSDIIEMEFEGQVGFYLHHEPLLDKSLFDKIKDINEKTKAYVVLSTNGQLLTESNINKMIDAKPRKVHLNINSGNKEEYESSMKGLKYETTINNCKNFIEKAKDIIDIEVNCPIIDGFDVTSLTEIFPDVKVHLDYWANSRGGLLPDFYRENKGSRFKVDNFCKQPTQNFNILYDGSTIACCMDWMHETKKDFLNVNNSSILEIYYKINKLEEAFKDGDYSKYKMCNTCSTELGFYRKEKHKMKILLTNHHFLDFRGSELFTLNLIQYLSSEGHKITLYSKYIEELAEVLQKMDVKVVTNLEVIKDEEFDIAHIHHNILALEVRYYFPELPMVFLSHGIIPFLEQPPELEIGIEKYLAVSEEVKDNLISKGVEVDKIEIFRNKINPDNFKEIKPVNKIPKNALAISNKIDICTEEVVREACNYLNIDIEFIGKRFQNVPPEMVVKKINKSDIVFTLGRGVIETMMCGRIPIVFDVNGGDGIVLPENIYELMKKNFSGRTFSKKFTVDELVKEIEKYDYKNGKVLKEISQELFHYNSFNQIIDIYEKVISEKSDNYYDVKVSKILEQIINANKEIVHYQNNITLKELTNIRLENAEYFIEIGDLIKAKEILLDINDGSNLDVQNNLAVIAIMEERFPDALEIILNILEINRTDEIALSNLHFLQSILEEKEKELNKQFNRDFFVTETEL